MFSVEALAMLANMAISKFSKLAVIRYTRSSFAELILFFSTMVNVDWDITVKLLVNRIAEDCSLIIGLSSIQDLHTQLYLRGLYIAPSFISIPSRNILQPATSPRFRSWYSGPTTSWSSGFCQFDRASDNSWHSNRYRPHCCWTSALRAEVNRPGWQNFFSDIQMSFGIVMASSDITSNFQEDLLGWRSRSDMMVSFSLQYGCYYWTQETLPKQVSIFRAYRAQLILYQSLVFNWDRSYSMRAGTSFHYCSAS